MMGMEYEIKGMIVQVDLGAKQDDLGAGDVDSRMGKRGAEFFAGVVVWWGLLGRVC
jgi:hypothetical protein